MSGALEHLRVAHHLALRARQATEFDAAALVRTWPEVASGALIAHKRTAARTSHPDRAIERASLDAEAMRRAGAHHAWPGPGSMDPALTQVSSALRAAADQSPLVAANDLEEANRLITGILWTVSEMVSRASSDVVFDLGHVRGKDAAPLVAIGSLAMDAHRRIDATAQMIAGALARPRDAAPGTSPGARLRQAVAAWDVESHRALLGEQSTAVLHVLAHLEAESIKGVETFLIRAPEAGLIDSINARRLLPVLRDSSSSWEQLRDASKQLSFASTTVPMRFIDAARTLQDGFTNAEQVRPGGDGRDVIQALASHLESSVTIAASANELIETGELRAPARAVARLITSQAGDRPSPMVAPVDAVAMFRGTTVPVPSEVRQILSGPARSVLENAHEAVRRASGLDSAYRTGSAQSPMFGTGHETAPAHPESMNRRARDRATSPTI